MLLCNFYCKLFTIVLIVTRSKVKSHVHLFVVGCFFIFLSLFDWLVYNLTDRCGLVNCHNVHFEGDTIKVHGHYGFLFIKRTMRAPRDHSQVLKRIRSLYMFEVNITRGNKYYCINTDAACY